jgi:hypothetical protein
VTGRIATDNSLVDEGAADEGCRGVAEGAIQVRRLSDTHVDDRAGAYNKLGGIGTIVVVVRPRLSPIYVSTVIYVLRVIAVRPRFSVRYGMTDVDKVISRKIQASRFGHQR